MTPDAFSTEPDRPFNAHEASSQDPARDPAAFLDNQLGMLRQCLAKEGVSAYQRWGLALFHNLNDEEAQAQREEMGIRFGDALDEYNSGCLLAAREDYAGAIEAFVRALAMDPMLDDAAYNQALALELLGRTAESRKAWQQYLEERASVEETSEIKQHLTETA